MKSVVIELSRFDGAVFDFDETMIDLEEQHRSAMLALVRAQGGDLSQIPQATLSSSGMRIVDEVAELQKHFGWEASLEELMHLRTALFLEELEHHELRWLPGVEDSVHLLRERGLKLAVASSGTALYIESVLARLGLRQFFEVVIAGEQVKRAKPDPEAFLLAAAALALSPSRCLVIEDSSVGVGAARRAGMFCLAVRNRSAAMVQMLDDADVVVESLESIAWR